MRLCLKRWGAGRKREEKSGRKRKREGEKRKEQQKVTTGARKLAQLVKHLLPKHVHLCLDPWHPCKKPDVAVGTIIPVLGKQRQEDSWNFVARQSS